MNIAPSSHSPARPLRAVVFDLDGTLLDSLDDLAAATNRTLAAAGYPTHAPEAYKSFIGDGVTQLVRRATPAEVDDAAIPALVERLRTDYAQNWRNKTKPYAGIEQTLAELAARGLKLGVLSNKPHDFTLLMVRYFFPTIGWAAIAGGRPGVALKPDPEAARAICEELGVVAEEAALVGDSGMDMAAASRASMLAVGALWGFRTEEELRAHGAALLVAEPAACAGALLDLAGVQS